MKEKKSAAKFRGFAAVQKSCPLTVLWKKCNGWSSSSSSSSHNRFCFWTESKAVWFDIWLAVYKPIIWWSVGTPKSNGARSECMLRVIDKTKQGNKRVVNLAWDGVFCFFFLFFFLKTAFAVTYLILTTHFLNSFVPHRRQRAN